MLLTAARNKGIPLSDALNGVTTQRGVGLIEVLIALVIFAIGVVGMAGLQLGTISVTMDSTQRSYVVAKSQDVADRIRSNGIDPSMYLGTYNAPGTNYCDTAAAVTSCADSENDDVAACTPDQLQAFDLFDVFCVGDGGFENQAEDRQQVLEWQTVISCEYPVAGVMTNTTDCNELGATVIIETSWFGRSVSNDVNAADQQRESMTLRFVP